MLSVRRLGVDLPAKDVETANPLTMSTLKVKLDFRHGYCLFLSCNDVVYASYPRSDRLDGCDHRAEKRSRRLRRRKWFPFRSKTVCRSSGIAFEDWQVDGSFSFATRSQSEPVIGSLFSVDSLRPERALLYGERPTG